MDKADIGSITRKHAGPSAGSMIYDSELHEFHRKKNCFTFREQNNADNACVRSPFTETLAEHKRRSNAAGAQNFLIIRLPKGVAREGERRKEKTKYPTERVLEMPSRLVGAVPPVFPVLSVSVEILSKRRDTSRLPANSADFDSRVGCRANELRNERERACARESWVQVGIVRSRFDARFDRSAISPFLALAKSIPSANSGHAVQQEEEEETRYSGEEAAAQRQKVRFIREPGRQASSSYLVPFKKPDEVTALASPSTRQAYVRITRTRQLARPTKMVAERHSPTGQLT